MFYKLLCCRELTRCRAGAKSVICDNTNNMSMFWSKDFLCPNARYSNKVQRIDINENDNDNHFIFVSFCTNIVGDINFMGGIILYFTA